MSAIAESLSRVVVGNVRIAADADSADAPDSDGRDRLGLTLDTDRRLIRAAGLSERFLHL